MASVTLTDIWIHLADDMAEYRRFPFVTSFERSKSVDVAIQKLAGGRLRAIRRQGSRRRWNLGLQAVTRDQIAWLEDHVSELMMVRDDRGHVVFGVYVEVPVSEHAYNFEGNLTLAFDEVTFDVAV